jgi:hypothetical protein
MITMTLRYRDAIELLAVVEHTQVDHPSLRADRIRRIAESLRCALLLCECEKGDKT